MRLTTLFAIAMLALGACGKSESKGGGGGGGKATAKLAKIKTDLAAAKTSEEVDKIMDECTSLQLESAMDGTDLSKNAEYIAVCQVEAAKALGNAVIKGSTPEKMDSKCISASMRIEDLIEKKIEEAAMKELNEQVKKACGM
jgi:hypothetical protein